jgi:MerC mercury resistance protein
MHPPASNAANACYPRPFGTLPRRARLARFADRFGASASFLCAVHCALLPLVIAVLPALGLGFLADHRYERGFIAFASVLALSTLLAGRRRHQRWQAFGFLLPGLTLLAAGISVDSDHASMLHAMLVGLGGTLVAAAHLTNLRLAHAHVHDADCRH